MPKRPFLLFDKSSLESLNIDEAALLSQFYSCVITPVFFVECLADLERTLTKHNKGTQESMVASLAKRTPDHDYCLSVHHMDLLEADLEHRPLTQLKGGPFPAEGKQVKRADQTGIVFETTKEQEAMIRWMDFRFLDAERDYAKAWRAALAAVNLSERVERAKACIGHLWRLPVSLGDARRLTHRIIDHVDPIRLLAYGLDLYGLSSQKTAIIAHWINSKRPPLRERFPQFTYMLSVDICFSLLLPTQLLRNVKESHVIELAYLYYLPYCSAFTSKDDFHAQFAALFLGPEQTFINGADLKADLNRLDERYTALDRSQFETGLEGFARCPPDDSSFLTTRLWDKYVPNWRNAEPTVQLNEQLQRALKQMVDDISHSTEDPNPGVPNSEHLAFVKFESKSRLQTGKYHRYGKELEERIIAGESAKQLRK